MCVEILMPNGRTLVTMRDVTEALDVIITDRPVYNGDLDICLCWLDTVETAKANGYGVLWPDHRMWAGFVKPLETRETQ